MRETARRRNRWRRLLWAAPLPPVFFAGILFLLDVLFPFPVERIRDALANPSALLRAADGSLLSWTVDAEENWRLPVALTEVSPHLRAATVAVEDRRFYQHPGVDAVAVCRALRDNVVNLRRVSGASTITMQTIRLLWPRPRHFGSKAVEAFRALQLERLLGKDQILELYLNLAPYGGNVVGAEAAARKYFGKSAARLTLGEASLLAGLPQSPSRYDPRRGDEPARRRRWQVLGRMFEDGVIDSAARLAAGREAVEIRTARANQQLGHFSQLAKSLAFRSGGVLETTLVPEKQARAAELAQKWGDALPGISGPAVVAVRVSDGAVVAYIGNTSDRSRAGWQIDAVRTRRQAGSLLKPFLFALLAEEGRIHPASRVMDTPGFWGDYAPGNMDGEWRGEMTAAAALGTSRNLPALRQLANLGTDAFAAGLGSFGLAVGSPHRQGLTMALGVQEQSLLNLTNAYAALARLGSWLPVKVISDSGGIDAERRVLSPEAAWLTLYAMTAAPGRTGQPAMAWKTGTSWNRQDAWAVAVTPELAVGVWCGRRRNGGGEWVTGAEDALPLALSVITALSDGAPDPWTVPAGIEWMEVCGESGENPGWHCPELVSTPVHRIHPPTRSCSRHGRSDNTGVTVPASVPAERDRTPGPRIVSPTPDSVFIDSEDKGEVELFLKASGAAEGPLFWFVNGRLLAGSATGDSVPWRAGVGSHRVVVTDGRGRRSAARFTVRSMEQD